MRHAILTDSNYYYTNCGPSVPCGTLNNCHCQICLKKLDNCLNINITSCLITTYYTKLHQTHLLLISNNSFIILNFLINDYCFSKIKIKWKPTGRMLKRLSVHHRVNIIMIIILKNQSGIQLPE